MKCTNDSGQPHLQFLEIGEVYQVQRLLGLVSGERVHVLLKTDEEYVPLTALDFRRLFERV